MNVGLSVLVINVYFSMCGWMAGVRKYSVVAVSQDNWRTGRENRVEVGRRGEWERGQVTSRTEGEQPVQLSGYKKHWPPFLLIIAPSL